MGLNGPKTTISHINFFCKNREFMLKPHSYHYLFYYERFHLFVSIFTRRMGCSCFSLLESNFPTKIFKNRTYKICATSWVHELSRKHRNAFLYQCFVLLDASYALKVAQETIRSTLLQNEKKSPERLLFGVKKSGMIFFSIISSEVVVISTTSRRKVDE